MKHWVNPVMQHQKFTLYDSIGAILSWTCHAGSKIHPVPQYHCNTELILSSNIRNLPCMTVLVQYWSKPVMQGQKYILYLSISTVLGYSCHATSEVYPVWQYWCNTEVNLSCRVKNTSCTSVSVRYWVDPALQHQKFALCDSIGAILT